MSEEIAFVPLDEYFLLFAKVHGIPKEIFEPVLETHVAYSHELFMQFQGDPLAALRDTVKIHYDAEISLLRDDGVVLRGEDIIIICGLVEYLGLQEALVVDVEDISNRYKECIENEPEEYKEELRKVYGDVPVPVMYGIVDLRYGSKKALGEIGKPANFHPIGWNYKNLEREWKEWQEIQAKNPEAWRLKY